MISPSEETELTLPGDSPGPPVLQNAPKRSKGSVGAKRSDVRGFLPPVRSCQGGAHLVEGTFDQEERKESGHEESRHTDGVRRMQDWVWSVMQWHTDRGAMVQEGKGVPHKLPGVASSNSGCKIAPEGSGKQMHSGVNRQSNSSHIYQQLGRDSLSSSDCTSERPLDVVSRERNTILSTISPRRGECQSGCGLLRDEGPLRLKAESVDLSKDTGTFPRPQYRSLRISSDLPTPVLLQLEAVPPSGNHGCLPPELEKGEGIHQLSLEPDRTGSDKSGGVSGRSSASGASVALSTLVPQDVELLASAPLRIPPGKEAIVQVGEVPCTHSD